MGRSASPSPSRKRPRLSSPTYDAHFVDLDSDDFHALDDIEAKFSQESNKARSSYSEDQNDSGIILIDADDVRHMERLDSQPKDPLSTRIDFTSAASLCLTNDPGASGSITAFAADFTSAVFLEPSSSNPRTSMHSIPSPEKQTENVASWFATSETSYTTGFTKASALKPDLAGSGVAQTFSFHHASGKSWAPPSSAALEAARIKLRAWEAEIESELSSLGRAVDSKENNQLEPCRVPLKVVENSVTSPFPVAAPEFSSISTNKNSRPNLVRPFKAPAFTTLPNRTPHSLNALVPVNSDSSLARSRVPASVSIQGSNIKISSLSTPSTPTRPQVCSPTVSLPSKPTIPGPTTPSHAPGGTPHKVRPLGLTPRAHAFSSSKTRPKFVTPFKHGLAPGEQGREALLRASLSKTHMQPHKDDKGKSREILHPSGKVDDEDSSRQVFDFTKPSHRKTLINCGLAPRSFGIDELTRKGLDVDIFNLTSVSQFLRYRFNAAGADISEKALFLTQASLGADTALSVLLANGCHLATKPWVDNHWPLILWKMMGMSYLDPNILARKWCWPEVMRQLRYRYAREVVNGARPSLRLITTHDAPASAPLVLCVSDVFWTNEYVDADGRTVPAHPELELTDGWYRLRASVDDVLARATRNRILRVGRKIACSGAKIVSRKKDPMEVLDAYGSMHLQLCGNSTHLAHWHAKLGFQPTPFVATLGSLSSDGGSVSLMDLLVTQVFPVGYIEYITTENGEKIREGPRNEKDEVQEEHKWKERRLQEALKLRDELEKKLHRLESCADRLERIAGSEFRPSDDESPPDSIENLVTELEDSEHPASFIKCVNRQDAGWLSQSLRKKCEADREKSGDEIDRELGISFPPRQVRNFRILRVQDARTMKKVSTRTAQLTVWDVMSLNLTEGGLAGSFAAGQRYMVTNLVATHPSAWMGHEPGSEVFLSTRRDSMWKIIR